MTPTTHIDYIDYTLEQIAKVMGVTRESVRLVERSALNKLQSNPDSYNMFQEYFWLSHDNIL